jgi:hypothetical protein
MSDNSGAGRREAIGADLVLPALAVGFAVYFFVSVWDLTWEAKANAIVIGVGLLALIALYLGRVALMLARGEATLGFDKLLEPRWAWPPRLAIVGLCAVFIFMLPWLGLTLGLFLLTGTLMVVLRAGSWRSIVATSGIVSVTSYLLFIALLNSRLPRGPIEHLFAGLFGVR